MGLTSRSTVLRLRKARSTFARPCIGADGRGGIERLGPEVGAQDIDAVEQGFGFDLLDLALERQIIVGDDLGEVLGHLVMVDHRADRQGDLILAAQLPLRALDAGLNLQQVLLGGVEQRPPFACAFVGDRQATSRSPG